MSVNEKKVLVAKLIDATKSPFEESDRGVLEGMDEKKLTSLIGVYEGETTMPVEITPVKPTQTQSTEATTQVASDQVTISKAQYEVIMAAANAHQTQQEQYRTSLMTSIKAAQSAFTEDDLKAMSTPYLEKLSTTLGVNEPATVDYSVRGISRPLSIDKKDHTPPKSWDLAINERKNRNQPNTSN